MRYTNDNTFARTNVGLVDGTNSFTAVASDSYGRTDSNTSISHTPVSSTFIYDSNGNLVYDGNRAFVYDDENQLTSVRVTNAWKSDFTYDGKGRRRVRKEYNWNGSTWVWTNEVRYVYSGMLVLQERDANNLPTVTYTRGLDLSGTVEGAGGIGGLLARTDNASGQVAYYHADGNGNITMLINVQQLPVAKYLYDLFGNPVAASGSLAEGNAYRFSSKEAHSISGLYNWGFRYLESALQRWITADPSGEPGGLNLYSYVENNPGNHIDPAGLDVWVGAGGLIGHQNISVGDPHGTFSSYSFAPDTYWALFNPFRQGKVYLDTVTTSPEPQFYKTTTPEEDAAARSTLNQMIGESWGYGLTYGSCRTFSQNMFDFFNDEFGRGFLPDKVHYPVKITVPTHPIAPVNSPVINIPR